MVSLYLYSYPLILLILIGQAILPRIVSFFPRTPTRLFLKRKKFYRPYIRARNIIKLNSIPRLISREYYINVGNGSTNTKNKGKPPRVIFSPKRVAEPPSERLYT